MTQTIVRPAVEADQAAILDIVAPVLAAGETYAVDRDLDTAGVKAYWFLPAHEVFVAEQDGAILGTYYLMANRSGGGAHVANCGYMTATAAQGKGIARAWFVEGSDEVGQEIIALGNRASDGELRMKAVRITVNNNTFDIYPERIPAN